MTEAAITGSLEEGASDEHPPVGRALRRAAYLTAAVGLAFAVLFILAYWIGTSVPGANATDEQIRAFYTSTGKRRLTLVALYIMPFAGIAFLWFIVALRMWISGSARRENVLFSNIQLVSGIVFIAMFFASASAFAAMAASVEYAGAHVDPVVARQFPLYGSTILFIFAMRMAAMFIFTTSTIGRNAGILPAWYTWAGYVVGIFLLLSATFNRALVLVFPVWVFTLCLLLIIRARQIPDDAERPTRADAV
ncbi:MAG: hypothetical protein AB7N70_18540 [Dehalococcoidia bacterium]